jgi:hypothetical protein
LDPAVAYSKVVGVVGCLVFPGLRVSSNDPESERWAA